MDEQQPELRWAPLEPAPKRTGRIWLIVGLSVAALAIVGVLLFLFLPRGDASPEETPSPSPSASPSATPTPTPTATPEPTQTPITTPPPATDPTIEAFRGKVGPSLDDATRLLGLVGDMSGEDAAAVVDSLQQDAQRLSDSPAPSSIAQAWSDGLSTYSQRLTELDSAVSSGGSTASAAGAARTAAENLRSLIGL
ncbi:hypothetical protein [Microbacterium sp. K24]|uniref:hypothetical protein n=1 Tax=Microbacterium sp. K24 TaxID=2305446 RepID=UPI001F0F3B34|nr:hypothetical protein [Microbacterium sp. K24]